MVIAGYVGKYHVKRVNKDYWYYVLTTGKNAKGKRIQTRKRGFNTKKDAEKALREAQILLDQGGFIESPSKIPYGEYMIDWMRGKSQNIGRQTALNYESNIRFHIIPELGDIPLTKISTITIRKFLNKLQDKGLASGTIKKIYNLLNTSLSDAEKMQLVPKNVAKLVEKPKVKKKEMTIWSVEEVIYFLKYVKTSGTRFYIIFHLALTTGMRQGELLAIRWKDIDLQRRTISVSQTLSHDGKELKAGSKTQSSNRSIAIDIETCKELALHYELIKNEKVKLGGLYINHDLVIPAESGEPYNPRNLDKLWNRLQKEAGITRINFHSQRHTHASILLKNNVHPKIVSERLGHSSIQMTIDLYSHVFPNMQSDAADELGKILFSIQEDSTE